MRFIRWLLAFAKLWLARIPWRAIVAVAWPLVGVALIGYGAFQIYEPAGFIVVGLLLILDMLHARRAGKGRAK